MPCRAHLSQLRQRSDELERLGVRVAVVTFEPPPRARRYVEQSGLSWPFLSDEKRELYKAYGMLSARFLDLWGPWTWLAHVRGMLRGHLPKLPRADVSQRGGDVLIDPEGTVRLHWVGDGPADRPPVGMLLDRVGVLSREAEPGAAERRTGGA